MRLAILSAITIWSSAFVAIRVGLRAYSPYELVALRFAVASVLFGVRAAVWGVRAPERRDWPQVLFAGLMLMAVYGILINTAEVRVAAGIASFVINTVPAFTTILSTLFLAERTRGRDWIGLGISLAGTGVIAFGTGARVAFEPAVLILAVAAVVQAIGFTSLKPVLDRYGAFSVISWGVWVSTACLSPFLSGALHKAASAPALPTPSVVYLGVFPTVVGNAAFAFAASRLPVARVTASLYFVPVAATFIGWILMGERPTPLSLVGGLIVILGVALVGLSKASGSSTRRLAKRSASPGVMAKPPGRGDGASALAERP